MTVSEFLAARLAEDERTPPSPATPAASMRWLRELMAKRAMLDKWQATAAPFDSPRQQEIHETLDDEVLPALASVYADHPDYHSEWAL